jgi:RNA polymerase sigma-70 factor, ECF subfamily
MIPADEMDDEGRWLEALYCDAGPQLLHYFMQRSLGSQAAEDLLQEVFAAALRHPERVARAASARAYLFGIARNLAATTFREHRETEPVPPNLAVDEPQLDSKLELMREAIGRLKPEFREIMELRLQHELTYEEIAEALGIPVGTVRSRLHHAVNELRRALHRDAEISKSKMTEL